MRKMSSCFEIFTSRGNRNCNKRDNLRAEIRTKIHAGDCRFDPTVGNDRRSHGRHLRVDSRPRGILVPSWIVHAALGCTHFNYRERNLRHAGRQWHRVQFTRSMQKSMMWLRSFMNSCEHRFWPVNVRIYCGGVGKRLTPAVLKTVRPERVSWVRIPPPPPAILGFTVL